MNPSSQQARTASGQPLDPIGEIDYDVALKGVHRSGKIYVTSINDLNLLGLDFIELFNLWGVPLSTVCNKVLSTSNDVEWLKSSFPQLFSDTLGCCMKAEVKMYVLPDVQLVFHAKRPVPFVALQLIQTELERLQKLDIISPMKLSDWANPIVAVKKKSVNGGPNKERVCADFWICPNHRRNTKLRCRGTNGKKTSSTNGTGHESVNLAKEILFTQAFMFTTSWSSTLAQ